MRAPRLPRIYTRTGDKGTTGLLGRGSKRVRKDDALVEALGACDSCNAQLGLSRQHCLTEGQDAVALELMRCQVDMLDLGADLAGSRAPERDAIYFGRAGERVVHLEALIDQMQETLEPLRHFILPGGGGLASAHLHVARASCRAAERRVVAVNVAADPGVTPLQPALEAEDMRGRAIRYLNRLGDYLFVAARLVASQPETLYRGEKDA